MSEGRFKDFRFKILLSYVPLMNLFKLFEISSQLEIIFCAIKNPYRIFDMFVEISRRRYFAITKYMVLGGKMVSIFNGKEIDKIKIDKLKNIAYRRYSSSIYEEYFADINSVNDLAYLHDINVKDENLAFGMDWFMCYSVTDYNVTILEWVSLNTKYKMQQVVEMMNFLKQLFIQNKDKWFTADMRHDTSF